MITKSAWRNLDTEGRQRKFVEFLQNKRSACKDRVVTSTFCKFTLPAICTAKKPQCRKTVEGFEFFMVLKDFLRSTVTG